MLSIGFRPTFEGKHKTIEVNILDFNANIYGEKLTIEFVDFIRSEAKFDDAKALILAMEQDEQAARKILAA